MDDWGLSILTMVVGAFLGSIISPASEMYFAKKFMHKGDTYSFSNGFVLLCAGNAAWVVSFILFEISKHSLSALIATIFLYIVAAILFIASFSQFKNAELAENSNSMKNILLFLVLGNLFWLIAEGSEVILKIFNLDYFPALAVKYALFCVAAVFFIGGVVSFIKERKNA